MGLDMYLNGNKFFWYPRKRQEDGFEVRDLTVQLGYWRKHPNLHGFIVEHFANGVDKCQQIPLTADDLKVVIQAVKERGLPYTKGFFFGKSEMTEEEAKEDIAILEGAIKWLEGETGIKLEDPDEGESREVYYKASW